MYATSRLRLKIARTAGAVGRNQCSRTEIKCGFWPARGAVVGNVDLGWVSVAGRHMREKNQKLQIGVTTAAMATNVPRVEAVAVSLHDVTLRSRDPPAPLSACGARSFSLRATKHHQMHGAAACHDEDTCKATIGTWSIQVSACAPPLVGGRKLTRDGPKRAHFLSSAQRPRGVPLHV